MQQRPVRFAVVLRLHFRLFSPVILRLQKKLSRVNSRIWERTLQSVWKRCRFRLPKQLTRLGRGGKLGIRVGNSILVRVKMVNDFNARKHLRTVPTTPQNGQTHTTQPQVVHTAQPQAVYNRVGQEVILPDPGAVGPPSFTFGDGEVTAPQPAEVYAPQPISAQ
jgi:hypothetical protein